VEGLRVRSCIRAGLVGGIVALYLALEGLVERFGELNLVGTQITLGRVLLTLPPALAAFIVMRPRTEAGRLVRPDRRAGAVGGALTGLVTGGVMAGALLWADWFGIDRIRAVFIAASPALVEFLSFDRTIVAGALILLVVGVISGGLGGIARTTDPGLRRPVTAGLSALIGFGLLQRVIPIAMVELGLSSDWLYSPITKGLTWTGAAVVLAGTVALSIFWERRGRALRAQLRAASDERPSAKLAVFLVVLALAAVLPLLLGAVVSEVLGQVMIFMLLGLGLNIVVGFAGLLDLGYVAFFAFGAYTCALLTGATLNTTTGAAAPAISFHMSFYIAVWIVALLAAGLGVLIGAPVLRLRGDYLAIVTLGLGEIVSILTTSNWLQPIIGGAQGMRGVTKAQIGILNFQDNPQHFYYLGLAFVLLALFVSWRLSASRIGRAWNAMREDEQVADAMGINTTRFKLLAFAMGGAIGSIGGALFAVNLGSLTPASFVILVSITALAVVILGGLGSLPGVIVGALVLIGLPGLLREFEEYRLLIYGGTLVAIMVLRPQGLVPNVRRMRELKEDERSQDAWAQAQAGADDGVAAEEPA
jgi:branched-chain amino acid transport system permease protein